MELRDHCVTSLNIINNSPVEGCQIKLDFLTKLLELKESECKVEASIFLYREDEPDSQKRTFFVGIKILGAFALTGTERAAEKAELRKLGGKMLLPYLSVHISTVAGSLGMPPLNMPIHLLNS